MLLLLCNGDVDNLILLRDWFNDPLQSDVLSYCAQTGKLIGCKGVNKTHSIISAEILLGFGQGNVELVKIEELDVVRWDD